MKCHGEPQWYGIWQSYTHRDCCLPLGMHTLTCVSSGEAGWEESYLEIQGERYCEEFNEGTEMVVDLAIVTKEPTQVPTTSTPSLMPTTSQPSLEPSVPPTAFPTMEPCLEVRLHTSTTYSRYLIWSLDVDVECSGPQMQENGQLEQYADNRVYKYSCGCPTEDTVELFCRDKWGYGSWMYGAYLTLGSSDTKYCYQMSAREQYVQVELTQEHLTMLPAPCFEMILDVKAYPYDVSWQLGDVCSGTRYTTQGRQTVSEGESGDCGCVAPGQYELVCKNRYNRGWYGGSIEINGQTYCDDSTWRKELTVVVTIEGDLEEGEWAWWSQCSSSCGLGVRSRTRYTAAVQDSADAEVETETCDAGPCAVCEPTCFGRTCDYWSQWYACGSLENWGCDCGGCSSCEARRVLNVTPPVETSTSFVPVILLSILACTFMALYNVLRRKASLKNDCLYNSAVIVDV